METLELAGRRFPVVALVCPLSDDDPDESRWDRSLGATPNNKERYIPGENGVIVVVQPQDRGGWSVHLLAPSCYQSQDHADSSWIWLPHFVSLLEGELVVEPRTTRPKQGTWEWRDCEDWWLAEHIDRITGMAFTIPPGPRVDLVDRDALIEEHENERSC